MPRASGRFASVHMQRVRKAPAGSFSIRLAMPPSTPAVTLGGAQCATCKQSDSIHEDYLFKIRLISKSKNHLGHLLLLERILQ